MSFLRVTTAATVFAITSLYLGYHYKISHQVVKREGITKRHGPDSIPFYSALSLSDHSGGVVVPGHITTYFEGK